MVAGSTVYYLADAHVVAGVNNSLGSNFFVNGLEGFLFRLCCWKVEFSFSAGFYRRLLGVPCARDYDIVPDLN